QQIQNTFLTGVFSQENVDNLINTWAGQIKDAVQEAAEIHDDQPSMEDWLRNVERLKNDLETVRSKIN
ncbi:MAG: hypothetical protein QF388_08655, partial [Acidimicrobiales bacterium]|nr:hypothetical protein [Acidimicrobiales bacterium]